MSTIRRLCVALLSSLPLASAGRAEPAQADWRSACPVLLTSEDLKERPLKLKRIHEVAPLYPGSLYRSNTEGSAEVVYDVDTEGSVVDVREIRSTDPKFFRALATAVQQWRYEKPTRDGQPVCVELKVSFDFRIR